MSGPADLGFTWRESASGEVTVSRAGRAVATLRGRVAAAFLAYAATTDAAGAQQRLARLTCNYPRGNERRASDHARNR